MATSNKTYMTIALAEVGQTEVSGAGNNPRIVEYHQATTLKATDDDVPWCASFANWVLAQAGLPNTDSASALSFRKWGVKTAKPVYGDIVLFDYGHGRGHVGFFVGIRDGKVGVLGGNQHDSVNVSWFSQDAYALEYRRMKLAKDSTTIIAAAGVAAVQAGSLATAFTDKVASATNQVVATATAGIQPDQMSSNLDTVSNFLLLFIPPEYQAVVQAAVTLAGVAWVIKERNRKLREVNN